MEPKLTTLFKKPNDLEFILGNITRIQRTLSPNRMNDLPYVFGGYVRDTLRGQPFQDMDVFVPCLEVAQGFVEYLKNSHRIISLETRQVSEPGLLGSEYQCITMKIETPTTPELKIDITYSAAQILEENSMNNCDFTLNNLMMDIYGTISTRVKAFQIGLHRQFNQSEWTAKCIRDCIEGKLVWMVPDRFSRRQTNSSLTTFMNKMNMRLDKMLSKGLVLTDANLTKFRLMKLRDISVLPSKCDGMGCCICHEDYSETTDQSTVVSKCSHHFHSACIQKWMEKKGEEGDDEPKCPCCRAEIVLYY